MKAIYVGIFILQLFAQACFSVSGKKVELNGTDTYWLISKDGNKRIETLYIDSVKIEENIYHGDTFISFNVSDRRCGEAEPSIADSLILPCGYRSDIGNRIDSLFSFFLPLQTKKDSFSFSLWLTVERTYKYSYSIFKDTFQILDIQSNSPLIRCKFPFSKKDEVHTYYLKKRTYYPNKMIETGPFEMFKENGVKVWVEY